MDFYSTTTQFYIGIFLSFLTVTLGKYIGQYIVTGESRRVAYHDRIRNELQCQHNCELQAQHMDNVEVIATKLFVRYRKGEPIVFELEALEIEITQRPKIKMSKG